MGDDWEQVILSAGRSSRMGFPKALSTVDGQCLVRALVLAGIKSGASDIRVVLGYHESRIRERLSDLSDSVTYVRNHCPSGDQTSSMKSAINSMKTLKPVLMQLVDHPVIEPETTRTIVPSDLSTDEVRIPTYSNKRGHPPYFPKAFVRKIRNLESDQGINSLYRHEDVSICEIEVTDPSVVVDLDRPNDLRAFRNNN